MNNDEKRMVHGVSDSSRMQGFEFGPFYAGRNTVTTGGSVSTVWMAGIMVGQWNLGVSVTQRVEIDR